MLAENNKIENEFFNLMDGLADSVLEMSDEEIQEEIQTEGDNSIQIRQILLNGVKKCQQQKLHKAKEQYGNSLKLYQNTSYEVPQNPFEKRNLIQELIKSFTQTQGSSLTFQHRDYENTPDEDLDGVLQQLFALKAVNKTN
jgi:hypothetical protein